MKTITDHLAEYAAYHRDRRNIATHLVGIPMIVVALQILLSRPYWGFDGWFITPALIVAVLASVFYLRLDRPLGILMTLLLALTVILGLQVAALATGVWLTWGIGLFVIGWLFQFIGHYFEGRKPAFVDDMMGLAIGPLFVVAEVVFMLGGKKALHQAIEARFAQK
ncbi:Mpo1 family 2-hydroxy fatty acid dioxygenase [Pseudidiomarina homiensis]|uniref:Mpo1 family 2-hydroxy fatty acid dioxygenase n=1 Tax=Pseudidiomarina homiensis TaxID=364198 RepID=UPI00215ADCF5|nr:Mpo1-like protein [Pseudidiomarina homiensis]